MTLRDKQQYQKIWQDKLASNTVQTTYMHGVNQRVDKVLEVLSPSQYLLDIGCGSGVLLAESQKRGLAENIYGIDISETALEIAKNSGVNGQVVNLNQDALPYPDNYFNTVTILATLQLLYDMNFVLGECHRVLKPCGHLLVSLPNMRTLGKLYKLVFRGEFPRTSQDSSGYDGGTLHYFCYRNIMDLFHANHFRPVSTWGIFCRPSFVARIPDKGLAGAIKREFFSGEILVRSMRTE